MNNLVLKFDLSRLLMCMAILLLIMASTSWAFWVNHGPKGIERIAVHEEITKKALSGYSQKLSSGSTIELSTVRLVKWLKYNKLTDDNQGLEFAHYHCDNDRIKSCTKRLVQIRESVAEYFFSDTLGYGNKTQELMGSAFHTLQDYYAHTNHIYRSGGSPEILLGIVELGAPFALIGDACDINGKPISGNLVSGWFFTPCSNPINCDANNSLDVYSLGGHLKCVHGNPFDISVFEPPFVQKGINNDHNKRDGYKTARAAAEQSTIHFMDSIVESIKTSNNTLEEKDLAICRLLGVSIDNCPIDDTSSSDFEVKALGGVIAYMATEGFEQQTNEDPVGSSTASVGRYSTASESHSCTFVTSEEESIIQISLDIQTSGSHQYGFANGNASSECSFVVPESFSGKSISANYSYVITATGSEFGAAESTVHISTTSQVISTYYIDSGTTIGGHIPSTEGTQTHTESKSFVVNAGEKLSARITSWFQGNPYCQSDCDFEDRGGSASAKLNLQINAE